jgi:hypothetical protein
LIESALAGKLLTAHPEWLTLEGYIEHVYPSVSAHSVLRRICPSPSGTSYELLYFWRQTSSTVQASPRTENDHVAERLKEVAEFQDAYVADHLHETLKVLKRSEIRRRRTERGLSGV